MTLYKSGCSYLARGLLMFAVSLPVHANSPDCPISTLRENYRVVANNVAVGEVEKNPDPIDEWDVEEESCISSYGANIGLGLSGLASGFLDGLADRACQALDGYVSDQLGQLGAAVNAPLDMAGVTVGIGESDSMLNTDLTLREIEPDIDGLIRDGINQAPTVDDGYIDYDGSGGNSVDDFDYINRGRGSSVPTPDYIPGASGRR